MMREERWAMHIHVWSYESVCVPACVLCVYDKDREQARKHPCQETNIDIIYNFSE